MDFPDDLKYTEEHEWVSLEENIATIGISDFAQSQLGDVVFVELPEIGDELEAGKPFGVVESVKAVSDLYAPLSGEVIEINERLNDAPELINASAYDDGWILKLRLSNPEEVEELMDADAYQELVSED